MYLRETMTNSEQVAYLVTLAHDEWLEAEMRGQEEYNFDDYLPFIGWCAVKICAERTTEWPI